MDRPVAFCVDFNWDSLKRLASPGLYNRATARDHVAWYQRLGVNVIQSFSTTANGFAWYHGDVAPVTPGLQGDFFREVVDLGHDGGMRVMGYACIGANEHWRQTRPQLSQHGIFDRWYVPLTSEYLDYTARSLRDALRHAPMDGIALDWLWNVEPAGLACEREMYRELMGERMTEVTDVPADELAEFGRRAVDRAWGAIAEAIRGENPDAIVWLSCYDLQHPQVHDSRLLREVDWLMNEHPDPGSLAYARTVKKPDGVVMQCVTGWAEVDRDHPLNPAGAVHDTASLLASLPDDVGVYGFAKADEWTTLPPEDGLINHTNVEAFRAFVHGRPLLGRA